MSIPNTITTADPIMKQASFNPSPVTFCNLPTDTLQKIQRFFPLRERATLPLVCDDFKGAKPLVSSEKAQFDELVERFGTTSVQAMLGKAVARGDANAIPLIVALGADANAAVFRTSFLKSLNGAMGGACTAAWVAARWSHTEALGVLLSAPIRADPNKGHTATGWTPCHAACYANHPDAVTVLCEHGADPNRIDDEDGWTPCMVAAFKCHTACLSALAQGAAQQGKTLDVNAVAANEDEKGQTALDIAVMPNKAEAAAFLRQLGGVTGEEVRRANEGFAREIVENAIDRAIACC